MLKKWLSIIPKKDLPTFDKAAEKMAFVKWLNKIRVAPANQQCCYICLDYFTDDEIKVCDFMCKTILQKMSPDSIFETMQVSSCHVRLALFLPG
jgi:hypothetical protein